MGPKRGFTANPEIWGETLNGYVSASNAAAMRLRKAGLGAAVRLTRYAVKSNISVRASAKSMGTIAAFGDHLWTVFIRPKGYKRAHGYHPRFWEPIPKRRRP